MGSIEWIERGVEEVARIDIRSCVDQARAATVARENDLAIQNPEVRTERFVSALPSLFRWFGKEYRDFPWRRTTDPWRVILAEVMLQRTHATKVAEVYPEVVDRFAGPEVVRTTDREELFELLRPLGFGNRKSDTIRSLAEAVIRDHDGSVPDTLDELQSLPRIGPYTARACLCFGYSRPLALVDSNIAVVMRDVFGYSPDGRPHKDRALCAFLDALIPDDPTASKLFNLALLDLRVKVCRKESERPDCPLAGACLEATS
jgi:A/G-specific adenine glycosylase